MRLAKISFLLTSVFLLAGICLFGRVVLLLHPRHELRHLSANGAFVEMASATVAKSTAVQFKPESTFGDSVFYADHLLDDQRIPAFRVGQVKRKPTVAVGIPSIARNGATYLFESIGSMLENLTPEQRKQCVFVIYLAEQNHTLEVRKMAELLYNHYSDEINTGNLEIIGAPEELLPNWENYVEATLGDKIERAKWRSKQNLDEQFLMSYLIRYVEPQFYLMMEDDVLASKNYMTTILEVARSRPLNTWYYASFSKIGGAGKLFHYQSTREFAAFIALFWNTKPLDWLFWDYIKNKHCGYNGACKLEDRILSHKDDLFKHLGSVSSRTNLQFNISAK